MQSADFLSTRLNLKLSFVRLVSTLLNVLCLIGTSNSGILSELSIYRIRSCVRKIILLSRRGHLELFFYKNVCESLSRILRNFLNIDVFDMLP